VWECGKNGGEERKTGGMAAGQATTCTTLRWMGYNSRRPHRVPLISSTKRKKRLQFARAHQNWTVEDFKNVV